MNVPEFCTCGAKLPPDARFCHKCGKPQFELPAVEEPEPEPPVTPAARTAPTTPVPVEISFHNRIAVRVGFSAALMAVVLLTILLPVPFVQLFIAFLAGFLAVFLYTKMTGQRLTMRSGARMGWMTGIFSFAIITAFFTVAMISISNQGGLMTILQANRSKLPWSNEQYEALMHVMSDPASLVAVFLLMLLLIFALVTSLSMLGGALGAKILTRER